MKNMNSTPVEPLPAATLLVLRDGKDGIEVFMTRRAGTMAFAPNAMVFPGGKVDPEDHHNGSDHFLRPFQNAVLREVFEEVGLLLALDGEKALPANLWQRAITHRKAIVERRLRFDDFLNDLGLKANYQALIYSSRWITPPHNSKRFDTLFFLAALPAGQVLIHDGFEAVHSEWVLPKELLNRADIGLEDLLPPTYCMLTDLSKFSDVKSAMKAMQNDKYDPDLRNLRI